MRDIGLKCPLLVLVTPGAIHVILECLDGLSAFRP